MRLPRRSVIGAALAAPMLARHGWAQSNDWPKGPVRWVVAYAAGGAADTVARNIGARVSEIIGVQVLIDNRTGGNSLVAETAVLQAPHDGQTFLVDAANQLTNEFLIKDIPFNYEKTWLPVTLLSIFPQVVAVKDEFPAKTIQEYIAAAKAKPDTISYGTPPAAGMAHMAGEALQKQAGIKLIHTPYRGGADAARDIGAGAIDSVIITTSSIRQQEGPRACGHQREARCHFPRRADIGRERLSGLRHERLERPVRGRGHARPACPAHEPGRRRGLQGRQGEGTARSVGGRDGGQFAGRVRRLAEGPARPARQADRRRQHQARVTAPLFC
jgi:tripartite-type tricarboxylate transporter receptor subunit TctC